MRIGSCDFVCRLLAALCFAETALRIPTAKPCGRLAARTTANIAASTDRERGVAGMHGQGGPSLSKSCVNALVQAGEVSQAEVNRRKSAGR